MTRRFSGVSIQGILQLLSGSEPGLARWLDGNLFAGLRVPALAAGARRHHENTESGKPHLVARLQRGSDVVEYPIHRLGGIVLGQAGRIRKLLDEIVFVHGWLLLYGRPGFGPALLSRFSLCPRSLGGVKPPRKGEKARIRRIFVV